MTAPRPKTIAEVRDLFLAQVRETARAWADPSHPKSVQERCDGVAFSILALLDGSNPNVPGMTLAPHPDDRAAAIAQGAQWFEPGMVVNDMPLHDAYYIRRG